MLLSFSRLVRLSLVLTVCAVLWSPAPARAGKRLAWKFEPGQKLKLTATQTMKSTGTSGGMTADTAAELLVEMTWVVQSVDEQGTADMTQTLDRVKLQTKVPGMGEISLDTASGEKPSDLGAIFAESIRPMIGAKVTQKMTARGEIRDVKVPDELRKAVEESVGGMLMKQFLSDEGLAGVVSEATVVLPEKELEKGDTWKGASKMKSAMAAVDVELTYTYEGEVRQGDKTLDKVRVESKLDMGKINDALGVKIELKDQENSGSLLFDAEAGRAVQTERKQKLTLEVSVGREKIEQTLDLTMQVKIAPAAP